MLKVNKDIGYQRVRFNPTRYKTVYQQWKQGYPRDLIAMMKESTNDDHISGCLLGRTSGFQKRWTLTPQDDNQKSRVEWLESVLNALDTRTLFKKIHEAKLYGYSVIDFDWDVIESKQAPVDYKYFDQKYFKWDEDRENLLIDKGKNGEEIPEETLVAIYQEKPIMLPVLRNYILKEFGMESWASFLETFGHDIIIGSYPAGAPKDIKQELQDAVDSIAESSRGTKPQGTEIETVGTNKSTSDHQAFTEACDRGNSIALLGHENAVKESSGMQIGENLTPFETKHEIAVDDIYFIDNNMQQLVNTLWYRNFGNYNAPIFKIDKEKPTSPDDLRESLDLAHRHGVKVHISEYEKLGLKVDKEEQEWIQKQGSILDLTD